METRTLINNYLNNIPKDKKEAFLKLREVLKENIPSGFEESFQYGMITYIVPYSIYPEGYECKPKLPLPFISIAAQKNYLSLYHLGFYADSELLVWFQEAYQKAVPSKLDMGKSCIRFKKLAKIPYDLIGELVSKMTVSEWIRVYEEKRGKNHMK
ncbi:MAG: DUF1801 domain-containing protein [Acholeplasmataceae bacterium]|nr:DUF1801 domain-containing protein [Acholeplasmataceae bacterium]